MRNNKTNNTEETMTNAQRRTAINKKIKSANRVYIWNGWAEYYFKSTKEDLILWFNNRYKRQDKGNHGQAYMDEFLNEMESNLRIDEENDLHFN